MKSFFSQLARTFAVSGSKSFREANPQLSLAQPDDKRGPRASSAQRSGISDNHETHNQRQISDSEPQRHQTPALDSPNARKEKSVQRVTVRFIGYRVRPVDPDNFAGGTKDLLDGLRHAGLIPGDEPWRIIFETSQEKVAHYSQERTLIEIESEQATMECKDE
jgi:hypothetical protein